MQLWENKAHFAAAAQHHVGIRLAGFHQGGGVGLGANHAAIVATGNVLDRAGGVDRYHNGAARVSCQHHVRHQGGEHFATNGGAHFIHQDQLLTIG